VIDGDREQGSGRTVDPVEAERRMLAQIGDRRALAVDIVSRLLGGESSGIGHRPRLERPGAFHVGLIRPSLPIARYARRETDDRGQVERFWWRRMTPHLAMFARRQAARAAISRPQVTMDVSEPRLEAVPAAFGPLEMALDPGGEVAFESGLTEQPGGGVSVAPAVPPAGGLAAVRAGAAAVWQRFTTILAPAAAASPPRGLESPTQAPAVEGIARAEEPQPIEPAGATPLVDLGSPATTPLEIPGLVSEPVHVEAAAVPYAEMSDLGPPSESAYARSATGTSADHIAPLAQDIFGRAGAMLAGLGSPGPGAASPARTFWWPSRTPQARTALAPLSPVGLAASSGRQARTTGGAPSGLGAEPVNAPHLPERGSTLAAEHDQAAESLGLDVGSSVAADAGGQAATPQLLAPGLLGRLLQVHHAAVASIQQPLALVHALRSAERWSETSVADLERWRVQPSLLERGSEESPESASNDSPSASAVDAPLAAQVRRPESIPGSAASRPKRMQAVPADVTSTSDRSLRPPLPAPSLAAPAMLGSTAALAATASPASGAFAGRPGVAAPVQAQDNSNLIEAGTGPTTPDRSPAPLWSRIGTFLGSLPRRTGPPLTGATPTGNRANADEAPVPLHASPDTEESVTSDAPAPDSAVPSALSADETNLPIRGSRTSSGESAVPAPGGGHSAQSASAEASAGWAPLALVGDLLGVVTRRRGAQDPSRAAQDDVSAVSLPAQTPTEVELAQHVSNEPANLDLPRLDFLDALRQRATRSDAPWPTIDVVKAAGAQTPEAMPRSRPAWPPIAARDDAPSMAPSLPERPSDASDAELAEILSRLPPPMAAAAIAAGVLGSGSPPSPLGDTWTTSPGPPDLVLSAAPVGSFRHAVAPSGPAASRATSSPWGAVEATHVPGPGWVAAVTSQRAGAQAPSSTASSGAVAAGSAAAGLTRAPIDRDLSASAPLSGGPTPATTTSSGGGTSGGNPPDLDRLTEEVFDRLRWRLAVERERYRE
jgi:hypothetical protein